jgi:hypothetical protein
MSTPILISIDVFLLQKCAHWCIEKKLGLFLIECLYANKAFPLADTHSLYIEVRVSVYIALIVFTSMWSMPVITVLRNPLDVSHLWLLIHYRSLTSNPPHHRLHWVFAFKTWSHVCVSQYGDDVTMCGGQSLTSSVAPKFYPEVKCGGDIG